MWALVREGVLDRLRADAGVATLAPSLEHQVASGLTTPGHAAQQILSLGTHAEVTGPPALRRRLAGIARTLATTYGGQARKAKRKGGNP